MAKQINQVEICFPKDRDALIEAAISEVESSTATQGRTGVNDDSIIAEMQNDFRNPETGEIIDPCTLTLPFDKLWEFTKSIMVLPQFQNKPIMREILYQVHLHAAEKHGYFSQPANS